MNKYISELQAVVQPYIFKNGNQRIVILFHEFIMFTVKLRYVYIHTTIRPNNPYVIETSLSDLEKKLSYQLFCRISDKCILPACLIKTVESETIILKTGDEVPYSRKYKAEILQRFTLMN